MAGYEPEPSAVRNNCATTLAQHRTPCRSDLFRGRKMTILFPLKFGFPPRMLYNINLS